MSKTWVVALYSVFCVVLKAWIFSTLPLLAMCLLGPVLMVSAIISFIVGLQTLRTGSQNPLWVYGIITAVPLTIIVLKVGLDK